eukprot:3004572-Prymnesium_polylepis.1
MMRVYIYFMRDMFGMRGCGGHTRAVLRAPRHAGGGGAGGGGAGRDMHGGGEHGGGAARTKAAARADAEAAR